MCLRSACFRRSHRDNSAGLMIANHGDMHAVAALASDASSPPLWNSQPDADVEDRRWSSRGSLRASGREIEPLGVRPRFGGGGECSTVGQVRSGRGVEDVEHAGDAVGTQWLAFGPVFPDVERVA